jgi:hypothetical protein
MNKIFFERQDWTPQTPLTVPVQATPNKIWTIKVDKIFEPKLYDKSMQKRIKKEFTEKFSSVYFMSETSVYFYFSDEADEALFMMLYSDLGFEL